MRSQKSGQPVTAGRIANCQQPLQSKLAGGGLVREQPPQPHIPRRPALATSSRPQISPGQRRPAARPAKNAPSANERRSAAQSGAGAQDRDAVQAIVSGPTRSRLTSTRTRLVSDNAENNGGIGAGSSSANGVMLRSAVTSDNTSP